MWKELVVVWFEIPYRNLPVGKEEMQDEVIIAFYK
jgi:hypothetical protein